MSQTPFSGLRFAPAAVEVERRADGVQVLRSPQPLQPYARCLGEHLERWAHEAPQRVFLAERAGDGWRRLTFGEALREARAIGAALLARGLSAERPAMVLSDNGIDHALLMLGAMHVGVPVAPISPAYSLMSKDYAKVKAIAGLLQPGLVYAADGSQFAGVLGAVDFGGAEIVFGARPPAGRPATAFADLRRPPGAEVDRAYAAVGPDSVAKFLFTSGSTGEPKGVINTQRMLCSNQQAIAQLWPFLAEKPPVTLDWLPWNHTFGGSHNVNLVLFNGGSLYIDHGRPMPGGFEPTLRNLSDISPSVYFNVPKGFELLVVALQRDAALREKFFHRLRACFFAGAGLSQHTWDALNDLAQRERGADMPVITGLGATECAPSVCFTRPGTRLAGAIGLPATGNVVKLVPVEGKLEMRVKGPNVTPGYWRQPEISAAAFDEEGYYRLGDAVRWIDERDVDQGLMFDGRIAEDFKLSSGTWVSVGPLRARLLSALNPFAQDVVIAGLNRDELGILIFPDWGACADFLGVDAGSPRDGWPLARLREEIGRRLQRHNDSHPGGSTTVRRALLQLEPPSLDKGEVTDKGSINQRMVLGGRAEQVARLYEAAPDGAVIVA